MVFPNYSNDMLILRTPISSYYEKEQDAENFRMENMEEPQVFGGFRMNYW